MLEGILDSAIAEISMGEDCVGTAALGCPSERSSEGFSAAVMNAAADKGEEEAKGAPLLASVARSGLPGSAEEADVSPSPEGAPCFTSCVKAGASTTDPEASTTPCKSPTALSFRTGATPR